jgi:hypothetical protein
LDSGLGIVQPRPLPAVVSARCPASIQSEPAAFSLGERALFPKIEVEEIDNLIDKLLEG